ncbi:MAG: tetratricopeptide repeat protein [Gammaproteobacteria bacterium]|nr:tetratricopeptide repeat protein [Gammaproteobacteria bacterium]
MVGCASTPETPPISAPDIANAEIDDSIRRPVPVYEFPENEPDAAKEGLHAEQDRILRSPGYSNESTSTSRTILALLDRASQQEKLGRPERAAAALERALRIEPKNARLWHRLAVIRFEQGQYVQAESLAAKSSALAAGDWHLKQKNAEIIQQVQQRRAYLR